MVLNFTASQQGILPDRMIAALAEQGGIRAARPFDVDQIQPASLDLRLGAIAYRVRASFLPGPGITVAQRIAELKLHEFSLAAGAVLETGCVYIVPLIESLTLPDDIAAATKARFTPRSARRPFRYWSAKVRDCRNYACAAATPRYRARRCAPCTRANGWSIVPKR
jgi:hypothetical protein